MILGMTRVRRSDVPSRKQVVTVSKRRFLCAKSAPNTLGGESTLRRTSNANVLGTIPIIRRGTWSKTSIKNRPGRLDMGYPSSKWGRHTEREVAMWRVFRNGKTVTPSNGLKRETNLTSNSVNSGMKNSSLLLGRGRGRHTANPERQRNRKPMSKPMPI